MTQSLFCCLQVQQATALLQGCPACEHNFKLFFCTLTCSPDQATFADVGAVQTAPDTNKTALDEVGEGTVVGFRLHRHRCKSVRSDSAGVLLCDRQLWHPDVQLLQGEQAGVLEEHSCVQLQYVQPTHSCTAC